MRTSGNFNFGTQHGLVSVFQERLRVYQECSQYGMVTSLTGDDGRQLFKGEVERSLSFII